MPRRSKEQIKKDREELRELIQNMESVQDIMKWKNHPYEADNKLFTVEAYNRDIIDIGSRNLEPADQDSSVR